MIGPEIQLFEQENGSLKVDIALDTFCYCQASAEFGLPLICGAICWEENKATGEDDVGEEISMNAVFAGRARVSND